MTLSCFSSFFSSSFLVSSSSPCLDSSPSFYLFFSSLISAGLSLSHFVPSPLLCHLICSSSFVLILFSIVQSLIILISSPLIYLFHLLLCHLIISIHFSFTLILFHLAYFSSPPLVISPPLLVLILLLSQFYSLLSQFISSWLLSLFFLFSSHFLSPSKQVMFLLQIITVCP